MTSIATAYLPEATMISIVDDDVSVREATKRWVRSLGYSAAAFASAEEFLLSGKVNDTECVITDVHMPGLSGIELQSHLISQGNRTPIIFVTAFPEERTRTRALEAGAIGFLTKPRRALDRIHRSGSRRSQPRNHPAPTPASTQALGNE
jgi:FixJ family two-component response regulator